jgi:ubiquinone/menaquinone biosynthesis C-methylase UbiE
MTTGPEVSANTDQHAAPPQAWDAIAKGYDRYVAPQEAELATEALARVGLRAGERFLDVAAGPGGLTLPAARIGAHAVATDWSPTMIERFEARVREEGLQNTEGRVMDVHALEFEDDSFDVTGSQFGVMLVPDQPLALREMVRVTRPGGRVLVIAYGSPDKFEALQVFIGALQAVAPDFPGLPDDPPPLEFQLSDPDEFAARLTAAGLREVRVEATSERLRFDSGDEMWNWIYYSNPIGEMVVGDLAEEQRSTIRQVLNGILRERSAGSGQAELTNEVHIGIGTK